MDRVIIEDEENYSHPLLHEERENTAILYHGTSSVFADIIEKKGFLLNQEKPFDINDVQKILEIYQSLGYGYHCNPIEFKPGILTYNTPYWSLANFVLKGNKWKGFRSQVLKEWSFCPNYWLAGNYASKKGGETISLIYRAVNQLLKLLNDDSRILIHKHNIKKRTNQANLNNNEYPDKIIERLEDKKLLLEQIEILQSILTKPLKNQANFSYKTIVENHKPVIFCVKVEESKEKNKLFDGKYVDKFSEKNISPENIVARIDFSKGHNDQELWYCLAAKLHNLIPELQDRFLESTLSFCKDTIQKK